MMVITSALFDLTDTNQATYFCPESHGKTSAADLTFKWRICIKLSLIPPLYRIFVVKEDHTPMAAQTKNNYHRRIERRTTKSPELFTVSCLGFTFNKYKGRKNRGAIISPPKWKRDVPFYGPFKMRNAHSSTHHHMPFVHIFCWQFVMSDTSNRVVCCWQWNIYGGGAEKKSWDVYRFKRVNMCVSVTRKVSASSPATETRCIQTYCVCCIAEGRYFEVCPGLRGG